MTEVYVLTNYWDTPDNEGHNVMGVFKDIDNAISVMRADVERTKGYYPVDYWEKDMTWEDDCEVHLGRSAKSFGELATIHCWEITKAEVQ